MASIDYQGAKSEIEKIFSNDSNHRKILFWYDAPKNFKEDVENDTYINCKVLICDRNEFEIKKIVEHDDKKSNFLIYFSSGRPLDVENWLLDILMYSEEYYADTVALTMRRLGINNIDLRNVISNHIKFFDNEARIKKLKSYIDITDETSADLFKMSMMATLTKANYNTIESILTELVFEDENHSRYQELKKFGFEDYFWNCICDKYNYDGDLKIDVLKKKFIFTAFIEQTIGQNEGNDPIVNNLPSFYQQFIVSERGVNDAKFFIDKIKSDKRYEEFQDKISLELNIDGLISNKDIQILQFADIFKCIDEKFITNISNSLNAGSLEYDYFERVLMNRINSMWHEKFYAEYSVLLSSVRFLRYLDKPIAKQLSTIEYIDRYTEEYYKIDTEYRKIVTYYNQIEEPIEEFEKLMEFIEKTYQFKFLDILGPEYSNSLSKQDKWEFVGETMSNDFYKELQKNQFKKIFVIISDALRYEIGHELFERIKINKILKGSVKITHMISPLPSITKFGMASLLPHKEIEFEGGRVFLDNMSTDGILARDAVLKAKNPNYSAISFEDINKMNQKELRAYCSDKNLVYIYHDVMDNAGEHNESKVFDVTETCITEIVNLIKKLFNNLQTTNFYVTADHGFIYRRNKIEESNKYGNITSLPSVEVSKRYIITDDLSLNVSNTTETKLQVENKEFKAIAPWGYDLFKTRGDGLQYVHGGTSLQETIVPLIHVSELFNRTDIEVARPVNVRLKSITRKITVRSFTLEFEQMEKVEDKKQAINCETYIIDQNGEKVSSEYKFTCNSSSDDPTTRITKIHFTLKNIQFDRNKTYFLILRDIDSQNEYVEKEQFLIDIIQFKMF